MDTTATKLYEALAAADVLARSLQTAHAVTKHEARLAFRTFVEMSPFTADDKSQILDRFRTTLYA